MRRAASGIVLVLALLLWAGCGSPQNRSEGMGAHPSATPWNRDATSGLAVRAVAAGSLSLGGALPVVVEIRNFGTRAVSFDTQGILHQPYGVRKADGSPAYFVCPTAGGLGTVQSVVSLEPGASSELARVDVAAVFAILEPGEYSFVFEGLRGDEPSGGAAGAPVQGSEGVALAPVPKSAPLRLSVGPGALGARDRVIRKLLPVLPEGWRLYDSTDDAGGVRIAILRERVPGSSLRASFEISSARTAGWRVLGVGPEGMFWVSDLGLTGEADRGPSDGAVEAELRKSLMPGFEASILKALQAR